MAERDCWNYTAARVDSDTEILLPAFGYGFKLRIAFETLRLMARRRPRGLRNRTYGLPDAGVGWLGRVPAELHEAVGTGAGRATRP